MRGGRLVGSRPKRLVENVEAWAEAAGWETRLTSRDVNEKGVIRYEVPVSRWTATRSRFPSFRSPAKSPGPLAWLTSMSCRTSTAWPASTGRKASGSIFHADPTETHSEVETERFPLDEASLNRVLSDIAAHA